MTITLDTNNSADLVNMKVPRSTRDTIRKMAANKGVKYGDVVAQQFAVTTNKTGPLNKTNTQEQGVIFISSLTGNIYKSPKIDIKKIREMLQNPYIAAKMEKRAVTYFPERVKIEVLDPKQNVAPEETKILQNMCEADDVRLSDRVLQADNDAYVYGESHYNPVWGRVGGRVILQKLRHLPSWSFDTGPVSKSIFETWSNLLPGVILGADGTPEYWQRKTSINLETDKITNILIVKNPKDEELAGTSKLIPLASLHEMLQFVLNTEMQVIARCGAPLFFIKITNPEDANDNNGGVSDVDFANMIIQNADKDHSYILRENMEVQSFPFDISKDNLTTESALRAIVDDYFSISNQISKNGTLIGGSAIPEFQLLLQAIKGLHNWLLAPFENLLNQYFVQNNYPEGWTVRLTIPLWQEDRTQTNIAQANAAITAQCADGDDLREKLGFEPADDNKWAKIQEYWSAKVPIVDNSSPAQFSKHVHEGDGEPLDPVAEEMLNELHDEIDELSGKIFKAVMKDVAA